MVNTETTEIEVEYKDCQNKLESQIDHLDRFIQDLVSHKLSLENANRHIEQLAMAEKDAFKKSKYYEAISRNIELLTKIFNSISELENIKYRYHKEIDDVIQNKIRLIKIDLRKLAEKINDDGVNLLQFFEKLSNVLSNPTKKFEEASKISIEENPEYTL
ncbi:MAG: hypothetical protein WC188_11005 [Candidatus Caldatribacteriota bacterium]